MRFVVVAAALIAGGCVEAVDLVEPVVQKPYYCEASPNKVVICDDPLGRKAVAPAG